MFVIQEQGSERSLQGKNAQNYVFSHFFSSNRAIGINAAPDKLLCLKNRAKFTKRASYPDKKRIGISMSGMLHCRHTSAHRPLSGSEKSIILNKAVLVMQVLLRYEDNTIFVTNIDPRGQAYKKKNRSRR